MTIRRCFLVALACSALAAGVAGAQSWAGRGRLQGEVLDPNGKPLEGAQITLRWGKDQTQGPPPLFTDKGGKWSYLGLAGGKWQVLIDAKGFKGAEGVGEANEFGPAPAIRVRLQGYSEAELHQAAETGAISAIKRGNELMAAQNWAEARAEYEKSLPDLEPAGKIPVQRGIAQTYFQEGQKARAISELQTVLTAAPDDVDTLMLLIGYLVADGRREEAAPYKAKAITELEKGLVATPNDVATLQRLITLLVAEGREKEAEPYIARLPAGSKVDPSALLNVGIDYYNAGQYPQALENFDRVVVENPDLADAYYYRGLTYLATNKTAEAKADFEKLLALEPNHSRAGEVKGFLKFLK